MAGCWRSIGLLNLRGLGEGFDFAWSELLLGIAVACSYSRDGLIQHFGKLSGVFGYFDRHFSV